ncbi:MAG: IS66 family insertion sequence element accessory protein TnpB [Ruminococcus sp.]|nr:IS66 family insertion sequence element accessory protein TnpB [Ruminococcus sp.]
MLRDLTAGTQVYLVTGYTDLRRSIDGLAEIVQGQLHLDPFSKALFLFCGRRRDRIKGLLWEGDGFLLLYKRLDNGNSARIKKNQSKETDIDLHGIIKKEKKNWRKTCQDNMKKNLRKTQFSIITSILN